MAIKWGAMRWVVLYILSVQGSIHFQEIAKIAMDRFGYLTPYIMGRFKSQGILTWPSNSRYCSITEEGRAFLFWR